MFVYFNNTEINSMKKPNSILTKIKQGQFDFMTREFYRENQPKFDTYIASILDCYCEISYHLIFVRKLFL